MNCSMDLKAYIVGEVTEEEHRQIETHALACAECREELERLALTRDSLLLLRDEEMPRRIAFVSDKVFEPNWWQRLWNSGPRLGFASAAMLSAALLVHAFVRPPVNPALSQTELAQTEAQIEKEVGARVQGTVAKAVADSEVQQEKKTAAMLETAAKRFDVERRNLLSVAAGNSDMLYKQMVWTLRTSGQLGGGQ